MNLDGAVNEVRR